MEIDLRTPAGVLVHRADWDGFSTFMVFTDKAQACARLTVHHSDGQCVLDMLSVSPDHRRKGYGYLLQIVRENMAKSTGAEFTVLYTKKDSWMWEWYSRRGYTYHHEHTDGVHTWMKKEL